MLLNKIILIFFLFHQVKNISNECPKIECLKEVRIGEKCYSYSNNKVQISLCKENPEKKDEEYSKDYYCPIQSDEFEYTELSCVKKLEKNKKIYPGGSCMNDADCVINKCSEEENCIGKELEEECENEIDCIKPYTCIDNKCQELRKPGKSCTKDTDCVFQAGCLNGKCTRYFSLNDGEPIDQKTFFNDGLSYCKYGTAYNGTCMNLKLMYPRRNCSESTGCEYNRTFDNGSYEIINIKENCLCGYNKEGKKYCLLGGMDNNYTRFIKSKMKYYISDNIPCHTIEHGINHYCVGEDEDEYNESSMKNNEIWALYNYKMYDSELCIIQNVFPNYNQNNDIAESYKSCPKYTCEIKKDNSSICLKTLVEPSLELINATILYNNSYKSVILNSSCNVNFLSIMNSINQNFIYNLKTPRKYYPGDYCENDCNGIENEKDDLICNKDKRCEIKNFEEKSKEGCIDDIDCPIRHYCDNHKSAGNTKTCKEQLKLNEECSLEFDCENHLTCFDSKCQDKYFTGDYGDKSFTNYDCKYMKAQGGFCMKSFSVRNRSELEDDDFFPCDENDDCNIRIYKSKDLDNDKSYSNRSDQCVCGFRNNEKKYCPLTNDAFPDLYDQYITLYKKLLKNKCHTRKRFDCSLWPIEHKSDYEKFIGLKIFFEKGHLFYKSEDCIEAILKGNFIQFQSLFIFIFIWIVIF